MDDLYLQATRHEPDVADVDWTYLRQALSIFFAIFVGHTAGCNLWSLIGDNSVSQYG